MKSLLRQRLQVFSQAVDSACAEISSTLDSLLRHIPNIKRISILESCEDSLYDLLESIMLPHCVLGFRTALVSNAALTFNEFFENTNWISNYPTLEENALLQMRLSVANITQALQRLGTDWSELAAKLGVSEAKSVTFENISLTNSDRHNNGQQVILFVFHSGTNSIKVLYKPRQLSHMDELSALFGQEYMPGIYIARQNYGWEQYIAHKQSHNLHDYYIHAGRLLALYTAINGTDAHFENVIATVKGPVIIDWETIFTNTSYFRAQGVNTDLVTFTGLVQRPRKPWEFWISKKPLTAGFQAFGETKHELLGIHPINDGTTDLAVAYSRHVPYMFSNRPGKETFGTTSHLIHGFRLGIHDFLMTKTSTLGLLENKCVDATPRQLIRHTAFYKWLMLQSLNPGILGDVQPNSRRRFFQKHLKPVFGRSDFVKYETECLLQGDVPIFYQNPGQPDLIDGDMRAYKGFFPVTALQCLKEKWRYMRTWQFLTKNISLMEKLKI